MQKIIFVINPVPDSEEKQLYAAEFKRRGFTLVFARDEKLLLRSDAALFFGEAEKPDELSCSFLETAAQRNIPVIVIHRNMLDEETETLIENAEVIDASKIGFDQLRTLIENRQKDIYVRKEDPKKGSWIYTALLMILTILIGGLLIWRISMTAGTPRQAEIQTEEKIGELVRNAVVRVYAESSIGEEGWRGCGFAVTNDGYIVTNAHVVDHHAVRYRIIYRENVYNAETIAVSEEQDIALMKADVPLKNTLSFDTSEPKKDETIYTVGYPGNQKLSVLKGTYIGTEAVFENGLEYTAIAMPLEAGISGSPVISSKGKVIGIASAKSLSTENLAWMVDLETAKDFLKDYIFVSD
jgi:hypothetical protein